MTWRAAAYEWPALVGFVLAELVAAAATLLARAGQWSRTHSATPHREQSAENVPAGSGGAIPAT